MRRFSPRERFRCAFRISNGFGGAKTFIFETEACLEKGYTIFLSLSLSGQRHFDFIGHAFLCPSQHSHLGKSSTGQFLCEGFLIFVMTAYLHSLLPRFCLASARPVYCLPSLHLQTLLTVHPSVSAYPFWYRQGDNAAASKWGGVSDAFDSQSLDPSARPVSLLNVQPGTRQNA